MVNYCELMTGDDCDYPCSDSNCLKEIVEFTDCTGKIFIFK